MCLALPAVYAAVAFALAPWASARAARGVPVVEAYVVSNGVHTDLVLPVRSETMDWTTVFPPGDVPAPPPDAAFVAIGWGDRDFYLHTPEWRDLTAGRALRALSGTGRSLLHVTWLRRGELGTRVWALPLDAAGHRAVRGHVLATLAPGAHGHAVPVPGAHYGGRDAFYEARGAYDVLTTCNTWTGEALQAAGVPVSAWTPFAPNVVRHLVRVDPAVSALASGTATPAGRRAP